MDPLVRDGLEVLMAVAVGGMLWAAIGRLRRGEIRPPLCPSCNRPASRASDHCKHCGAPL
jgi:predicted amidophosphoribosyltransferase